MQLGSVISTMKLGHIFLRERLLELKKMRKLKTRGNKGR